MEFLEGPGGRGENAAAVAREGSKHSCGPGDFLVDVRGASLFIPGDRQRRLVLRGVSWRIGSGEHCALLGPNGSGKSTLLRLLGGELWPCSGGVAWRGPDGPDESPMAGRALAALVSPAVQESFRRMGWDISVDELLAGSLCGWPPAWAGEAGADDLARGRRLLDSLELAGLAHERVPELSQGQLRLALLCAALLRRPQLLLLDEWADGLDGGSKARFFRVLEAAARVSTVILASHREDALPGWVRGRRYMLGGRLLDAPPAPYAPPAPRGETEAGMPARAGRAAAADMRQGPSACPLMELSGVNVYVNRKHVLHDLSWRLLPGENWRIDGANGSGKSTFLRLLAGDEFAASGGVLTRSFPGRGGIGLEGLRRAVCLVSDLNQASYDYDVSGLELVLSGFDNSQGLFRAPTRPETDRAATLLRSFFGPEEAAWLAGASIRRMSTGQLRSLFLARAMACDPAVLLLDEPCNGLDARARDEYLALLDGLCAAGLQIVFVSHYPEDAPSAVNRLARMERGRLFTAD